MLSSEGGCPETGGGEEGGGGWRDGGGWVGEVEGVEELGNKKNLSIFESALYK